MILINNKEFSKLKYYDVEEFLNNADLDESFFVEFKNDCVQTKSLAKEICALSNTFGGYVFLGVEDNKEITGCTKWTEEKINNVFRDLITPNPSFDIKKLTKDDIVIYVIRIDEGIEPPYITNSGVIYERISSSSNPVRDSATINRILEKRKENIKNIENKLYIAPIKDNIINLCGYLDFGFSVLSRDVSKIIQKLNNTDFEAAANHLKKLKMPYSISKVGNSICIGIGTPNIGPPKCGNDDFKILVPAGLNNFMEILPDGSVRGRILFNAPNLNVIDSGVILMMYAFFEEIYSSIFNDEFSSNFIEARKYEKLTVLKIFEPKILDKINDKTDEKFKQFSIQHNDKYGSNVVINSNRIPMNDFYVIDKQSLQEQKIEYNDKNLFMELFRTSYYFLGYIDELEISDDDFF